MYHNNHMEGGNVAVALVEQLRDSCILTMPYMIQGIIAGGNSKWRVTSHIGCPEPLHKVPAFDLVMFVKNIECCSLYNSVTLLWRYSLRAWTRHCFPWSLVEVLEILRVYGVRKVGGSDNDLPVQS
jgi:hypothetical protein